jgi:hemoglobin
MKNILVGAAFVLAANLGFAQEARSADPLFKALGEKPGLVKLMDDFIPRLVADARTGPFFRPVDQKHVKAQLVEQICQVSGGPCDYQGKDMKSAHMDMNVSRADFNAQVEVLQTSMDAQGIAFSTQNQLLARLAPLHRAVVTPAN